MQIQHLRTFIEITKYNSINQAAQNLYIGQPTLSAQIKALEAELDLDLFIRSKKGISLTPEGEIILNQAKEIISIVDSWHKLSKSNSISGKIHIVSPPLITGSILLDIIERSKDNFPDLNIIVHEFNRDSAITYMISHPEFRFGISYFSTDEYLETTIALGKKHGYDSVILFQENFFIVMSPANPLANKEHLSLDDLKGYKLATINTHSIDLTIQPELSKIFPPTKQIPLPHIAEAVTLASRSPDTVAILSTLFDKIDYIDHSIYIKKDIPIFAYLVLFFPPIETMTYAEKHIFNTIKKAF